MGMFMWHLNYLHYLTYMYTRIVPIALSGCRAHLINSSMVLIEEEFRSAALRRMVILCV